MKIVLCAVLWLLLPGWAQAAGGTLPGRDLTVELRQVEEGREGAGSYSAGGVAPALWEPQSIQVRNGDKAVLRMNDAIPMQWTTSVETQGPMAGGSARPQGRPGGAGAGASQALAWFDAGQSMSVQPKWPGGNKPATLEIEVQRAAVGQRTGAELPAQSRNTVSTTLTVPLAEWVTVASTGRTPKAGSYSSASAQQVRRLLQVRVMAP